ncbi:hematopoietic SH2 domain-containing protein homolog isoform X2 [Parambassis ranga]|nr:hematopoietic SH2 domain-containing protein homolog isoform X2 [Parambassis ranga]
MMESQRQHDAFTWFTKSQLQAVVRNGMVPEWFHGIISRKTAEELLMPKPPGYFLIRVSESRIGYTLSYRDEDRCRHFMVDVLEDGQYIIVGEDRRHRFLQDLVDFHRRTPIMPFYQVLTVACGQSSNDKTDYAELLFPQRHLSLVPTNPQLPSLSPPVSQEEEEDVPPALPYRANNPMTPTLIYQNTQPNRLYPDLENTFRQDTSTVPTMPVPMTRKRYTADNPPSDQPPEVPSRSCLNLKQNQACIRTVSVPDSPSTFTASEHSTLCVNIQPLKIHESKPSVVTNLKNFRRKFQKKRSSSQDNTYAEINMDAADGSGITENEYQEIPGAQTFRHSPLSQSCTDVTLAEQMLPQEYMPPPPFAPGY